jgi:predicted DNA-binding transcriptional regulator YafY
MSRGKRESQWLVIRRCLTIIRRVQRGPTDWRGLVAAVLENEGPEAYGRRQEQAKPDLLHADLGRIRRILGINLKADRRTQEYDIRDTELPLLDLPDDDLVTIAWLEQTFNPNSPKYREIQALLKRLQFYLSPQRREIIEQQRTALVLDLGQRDEDRIDPDVEAGFARALARRLRVEFDYHSPQHEDEQPRRHVVDFYEPSYFDTEGGHYYVYGWCHYAVDPQGNKKTVNDYSLYRLGRISNLRLLPDKLAPSPPTPKQYPVIYRLSKDVARYGVTYRRWINIERIEQREDSVEIHGATTNPFLAVQELMHYRSKCQVLGGPEMLDQMKKSVEKMAALYKIRGNTA